MAERRPDRRPSSPPPARGGVLGGPVDGPQRVAATYPTVEGRTGMKVVHRASRFTGQIAGWEAGAVILRGASSEERVFRLVAGAFGVDGQAVSLRRPAPAPSGSTAPKQTASGSIAVAPQRARVALGSRIWVEGIHDAELVERVWGDDLRVEGVVVERLDGIDGLERAVAAFGPAAGHRLGVLVDHLVPGSKEARLAAAVRHPHVLVLGTPYVDVWQAVKPAVVGIRAWPVVPPGRPWKEGVCEALGVAEPGALWRRILASVKTFRDLEPALVGAVEALIDFVTVSD